MSSKIADQCIAHCPTQDIPRNPSSAFPLSKRTAEEDVQFLSSKPVKKMRLSGQDVSGAQPQPPAPSAQTGCRGATAPAEHPHGPFTDATLEPRGTSLPDMEHFSFPPSTSAPTTTHPPMSPALSPKQLPCTLPQGGVLPPAPPFHNLESPGFPDMRSPVAYPGFGGPYGAPVWMPQFPMTPEAALHQRMLMPPMQDQVPPVQPARSQPARDQPVRSQPIRGQAVQNRSVQHPAVQGRPAQMKQACDPPVHEQHRPGPAKADKLPSPPAVPAPSASPVKLCDSSAGSIRERRAQTDRPQPDRPSRENSGTPAAAVPTTPSIPQATSATLAEKPASARHDTRVVPSPTSPSRSREPSPQKTPCLVCARLRQQALINSAKGLHASNAAHGVQTHQHAAQALPGGGHAATIVLPQGRLPHLNAPMGPPMASPVYASYGTRVPIANMLSGPDPPQPGGPPPPPSTMDRLSGNAARGPAPQRQGPEAARPTMPRPPSPRLPRSAPSHQQPATVPHAAGPRRGTPPPPPPRRRPPPNLIVDIAETCEELFPFDAVAARHSVPRHKVAEAFAAVIQLPLLRCATDRRRHGKLASARVREYGRARRDAQQAAAGSGGGAGGAGTGHAPVPAVPAGPREGGSGGRMLPGVMEIARAMSPVEYQGPDFFNYGFPRPW